MDLVSDPLSPLWQQSGGVAIVANPQDRVLSDQHGQSEVVANGLPVYHPAWNAGFVHHITRTLWS